MRQGCRPTHRLTLHGNVLGDNVDGELLRSCQVCPLCCVGLSGFCLIASTRSLKTLLYGCGRLIDQTTRKTRSEPRSDLRAEHEANPDLACLQRMDRTQIDTFGRGDWMELQRTQCTIYIPCQGSTAVPRYEPENRSNFFWDGRVELTQLRGHHAVRSHRWWVDESVK